MTFLTSTGPFTRDVGPKIVIGKSPPTSLYRSFLSGRKFHGISYFQRFDEANDLKDLNKMRKQSKETLTDRNVILEQTDKV